MCDELRSILTEQSFHFPAGNLKIYLTIVVNFEFCTMGVSEDVFTIAFSECYL